MLNPLPPRTYHLTPPCFLNAQLLLNRLEQFEQKLKLPPPSSKPSSAAASGRTITPAKPMAEATSVQTEGAVRWRPSAKGLFAACRSSAFAHVLCQCTRCPLLPRQL